MPNLLRRMVPQFTEGIMSMIPPGVDCQGPLRQGRQGVSRVELRHDGGASGSSRGVEPIGLWIKKNLRGGLLGGMGTKIEGGKVCTMSMTGARWGQRKKSDALSA